MVDNGSGLSYDDLGFVGERYMTSKCHTVDDINTHLTYFGYRGEAVASIVDIAGTVELCSRHRLSQNTYSKVFHNGKAMPVTASKSHRPSVGTTVSVHDFFYNMPVRKKGISAALELEQVKRVVESIALINPSVSFSVRNDVTGECVLQTHKTDSVMNRFGLFFGRDKTSALKDVSLSQASFGLSGFISTEGHHNKSLQFIYVNGRIVRKTPLHLHINNMLANSLLTRKLSRVAESSLRKEQEGANEVLSPNRIQDVFGVYVLHLKCSRSEYDICLEPAKTLIEFKDWDRIKSVVEELVQHFLFKNNLNLALIRPGASNPVLDQQQHHQLFTTSVINENTSAVNPHLSTVSVINESILAPSLQSRTVRRPHLLASAGSKEIQQGSSYLPQSVLHIPEVDRVESKRVDIPGTVREGCTHTTMTATDNDPPVQEDLSNCRELQANMLPVIPPCGHPESGYCGRDGGEWSVTDCRPLSFLPTGETHPTMNYDELSIYDTRQHSSIAYTMSPVKVHANSCIPDDPIYACSTNGGQLMSKLHMQNDGVNSSKDSGDTATCAPLMFSTELSDMRGHSPLTHTSYRSPLQSSISSKLSELFRSNSKKELTSTSPFYDGKKKYQLSPSISRVNCQSLSTEWKRSDSSDNAVGLNLDVGLALPQGERTPSLQSSPLASSVANTCTCTCTSSYISKQEYSYNGVHPTFNFAPSVVNLVPTITDSLVSTTSALGHPVSLGVWNTKLRDSLTVSSESATASRHVLCSTETAANLCTSRSLYQTSTIAIQSPSLASDTCLMDRLDSESYIHPDDLLAESTSSYSKSTAIKNQKGIVEDEDEQSIHSTAFTDDTTSVTESPAFDSMKPVWKEVADRTTGRTLYVRSISGNCVSSLPRESSTSRQIFSKDSLHDSLGHGSLNNISSVDYLSSMDAMSGHSICLNTQLSRDTFQLRHHQKLNCHRNTDRNFTSNSDLLTSSVLINHQPWMELLGTKWRHQNELNEICSIRGSEMANCTSFQDVFKRWKNPTFHSGEKVIS